METGYRYPDLGQKVESLGNGCCRVRVSFSPEVEVPVKLGVIHSKFTGTTDVQDRSGDPQGNIVEQMGGGQLLHFDLTPTEEDYVYRVYMVEMRNWEDSSVFVTPYISNTDEKATSSQLETLFMRYEGGELVADPRAGTPNPVKSQLMKALSPLLKTHPKFLELVEATRIKNT